MDKNAVREFFDRLAPKWDSYSIRPEEKIAAILDNAGIVPGVEVLDVACGTGILFPDYLSRGASSVTGIDISPKMAEIAAGKYAGDERVSVLSGDAAEYPYDREYDRIVVYDAFPHFADPDALIGHLASVLRPGGILTVAHSAGRDRIDAHHSHEGTLLHIATSLMTAGDLAKLFEKHGLEVTCVLSEDYIYQVAGRA